MALDPEEELGVDGLRAGIATPQAPGERGEEEEQKRAEDEQRGEVDQILRVEDQRADVEAAADEVEQQRLKGIRINVEDIQLITEKKTGKFIWRIKSQLGTILGMSGMFTPFIALGPKGIKELKNKAMAHFKPLMDMIQK